MDSVSTFRKESELDFVLSGSPKGICYATLAGLDLSRFGDKALVNGGKYPYYSKTHSVNPRRLRDKLSTEGRFAKRINGRAITHIRLAPGEHAPDETLKFVNRLLDGDGVGYLTLSRGLTVCAKCGFVDRAVSGKCGRCRSRNVSVWSRDTGHLQSLKTWSPARRQAYVDEYRYDLSGAGTKLHARQRHLILNY